MRTSKPIATISYNTREYLQMRLEELIASKRICDYMYIVHTKEEDEKKDHIHLWIKPNTLLDTMDLQLHFAELDMQNPTKPKGCIDFRTSAVDDWILYCQHYAPYLASKGESREFAYTKEDFFYHDEYTFDDRYAHAFKGSEWAQRNQILSALTSGQISPTDLILNGSIPLNMASQVNAFMYMRRKYRLDRGGRSNHESEYETYYEDDE